MRLPGRALPSRGRALLCLLTLGTATVCRAGDWLEPGERRASFDAAWSFQKGDPPGAEKADFADQAWRRLDLPHDWAIEGPFDPAINPHTGALPSFGVAWYRKRFAVPESARGRYYSIEIDGAMANATVFLNGHELGGRPYGYIGFGFDLTPQLRFGGENVLAVRLAPEPESSRWYPGAGLYRHVWIEAQGPVHVERWGTYVTTPAVSDAGATVSIRTELRNREGQQERVTLETAIVDPDGREVTRASSEPDLSAGATEAALVRITVPTPVRWDLDRPRLYRAVSTVLRGGEVLDRYVTPFGIRTIEYGPGMGFLLNGRRVPLRGVCDHHDLGALGTAVNRRAIERQLEILKGMGANAIRTSHNPPAPELLEAADRLGFLVMDEAFDMWNMKKVTNGHGKYFAEWGERDLRDMIRRDRNHPSVVMWSIGNEILEQASADGWKVAKRLTEICHEEDPTRPVTAGFNEPENAIKNHLADQVDVPGFNYGVRQYASILAEHPGWTIVGSETASCVSSRGVYHLPIEKYEKHPSLQLTSYDVIAPPWAYCPDVEFAGLEASPAVLGEFVWTGFDYIGEPTPYFDGDRSRDAKDWPAHSSYFGIVDLAGFPKDRYYLYESQWTKEPMVHLLPHWSWAGQEGRPIPVMAYTNTEEVELFLNDRSLGRKRKGEAYVIPVGEKISPDRRFTTRYRLVWDVPYAPGTLKAVAYSAGKAVATAEVKTAGAPARVVLVPDRTTLRADGEDLSFLTARIEDAAGSLVPGADNLLRFAVEGPGRIAAVDNGNAASLEPFQASSRKAFSGLALLIVRSKAGEKGQVLVTAASDGLVPGRATLAVTAAEPESRATRGARP
ncbi:MAG TPA: beta-galactosidase GalB [Vicinamibacteria bacterium]|nr:beta-galactosidase GalB [Vicinamibacteria bacterium]